MKREAFKKSCSQGKDGQRRPRKASARDRAAKELEEAHLKVNI